MKRNVLAFDFGASSGRALLGRYHDGILDLKEIHRFPNHPVEENGVLYWDIEYLFNQIKHGIKIASKNCSIDSLGIDTWGVDFGLIDDAGELIKKPVHYRDQRTQNILAVAKQYMPLDEIYQRTGNQLMEINTIYQLLAEKKANKAFDQVTKILFMPDLFNYLLTGKMVAERSIASTGQLMDPIAGEWAHDVIEAFEFPAKIFPTLVSAGNILGFVKKELSSTSIKVINVCEHDTASAVVSVPCSQNFLFISCGTWSLVGTELSEPIINGKAYNYNLTNESGINSTTRFMKNCTGLWIIQELNRNFESLGRSYSYATLTALAYEAKAFQCLIDTDHPMFSTPGDMIGRIKQYAQDTNQVSPRTDGALIRCVYESLALKYKQCILEIMDTVQRTFETVYIVGGGSQAEILCQMVADACHMNVCAGPIEATAIGNIAVQLLSDGVFDSVCEVRNWIRSITETTLYRPSDASLQWDKKYVQYQKNMRLEGEDNAKKNS